MSRSGPRKKPTCRTIALGVSLAAGLYGLAPAIAQPPRAGVEFRVDDGSSAVASDGAVAASADGAFVVAWRSANKRATEVRAQRFDAEGERVGDPIVVASVDPQGGQPAIAVSEEGAFLVVWPTRLRGAHLFGQRYDSEGTPVGAAFRIDTTWSLLGRAASVAINASGESVVVWDGRGGALGQSFDEAGVRVGGEFALFAKPHRALPSVAIDGSGRLVVTGEYLDVVYLSNPWDYGAPPAKARSSRFVVSRRFDQQGGALELDEEVARVGGCSACNAPALETRNASVAMNANGVHVVAFSSSVAPQPGVILHRHEPGVSEALVRIATSGAARSGPAVAVGDGGETLVVWGARGRVSGRFLDASGEIEGGVLRVSTRWTRGLTPSIAIALDGSAVVVWSGDGGVFGQRYRID